MKSRTIMKLSAVILAAASAMLLTAGMANAAPVDKFGGWADIGDPENDGETQDYGGTDMTFGRVDYSYKMAKNEVSIADWEEMVTDTGSDPSASDVYLKDGYDYWESDLGSSGPAVELTMDAAAAYANWLTTGDMDAGAYTFDANDEVTAIDRDYRNANGMLYAIPTEDEYYKAAFYDPDKNSGAGGYWDYAHGQDTVPPKSGDSGTTSGETGWNYDGAIGDAWVVDTGSAELNDTRNMMGNVAQWLEDTDGVIRGGTYTNPSDDLKSSGRGTHVEASGHAYYGTGFRVVAIPEPGTAMLLLTAALGIAVSRRRRRD